MPPLPTSVGSDDVLESVSCRRCRLPLLSGDHLPVKEELSSRNNSATVLPLTEDNFPAWLTAALVEGGWTKGKLTCPRCANHVGGYDFITGNSVTAHIVRSKVDLMYTWNRWKEGDVTGTANG